MANTGDQEASKSPAVPTFATRLSAELVEMKWQWRDSCHIGIEIGQNSFFRNLAPQHAFIVGVILIGASPNAGM